MDSITAILDQAVQRHESGDLTTAEAIYRRVLSQAPTNSRALRLLGVLMSQQGQFVEGITLLQKAALLSPNSAVCRNSLGEGLRAVGRLGDAVLCFEQTVRIDSNCALGWFNWGSVSLDTGPFDHAEKCLRRALQLRPDWADAHHNLGFLLAKLGRRDEAIAEYRKAIEIRPGVAETQNNLGTMLFDVGAGDVDVAIACYQNALRIDPQHRNALLNLGNALASIGRIDEAIDMFTRLIAIEPQHANAHFNRAVLWLKQGNFAQGWPEYEWRDTQSQNLPRGFAAPRWDGSSLSGRAILLHAEQGLGDTLQFVRYAPLVRERGGNVIVECQSPLQKLLETASGIDKIVIRGEPLPPFDAESPLMSLPGIFQTTLATVPQKIPYLSAERARSEYWQREVTADGARLRIGIVWQGSTVNQDDSFRSIHLAEFAPLARIDGVRLYTLQKGAGAEQVDEFRDVWPLVDLRERLDVDTPFADSAALINCLDLVITSDTSIAHLAGALGRPVWVALQTDCDHRWLLERSDSPWYPTMRLFRQRKRGEWPAVFAEMAAEARTLSQ